MSFIFLFVEELDPEYDDGGPPANEQDDDSHGPAVECDSDQIEGVCCLVT